MKKFLAVAVILLFIGLAITPSINANVSKEALVEFTTEVCGLNGGKQTVKLTQEEAEEVEALFNSIREELDTTDSMKEAEKILNEAVVELDRYGLLGGLSIRYAQRLVSFYDAIQRSNSVNEMSDNENAFCLIFGGVTRATFIGPIPQFAIYINKKIEYERPPLFLLLGLCLFFLNYGGFPRLIPLRLGSLIGIGFFNNIWMDGGDSPYGTYPSKGWIQTFGINGPVKWDGELVGVLDDIPALFYIDLLIGVKGFFGLRIINGEKTYFLGFARKVNITYD